MKFGWSEFYQGGPIDGNFPFIAQGGQGHEAWNFLPQNDGWYYCYTPPVGIGGNTPNNPDNSGWTVVCLAKKPRQTGLHIVGWYENAELMGEYKIRPNGFDAGENLPVDEFFYSIRSKEAWFVPPEKRTEPFSHRSIKMGKYSFLDGPDVVATPNKGEVLNIIAPLLEKLRKVSVYNPNPENNPDYDNDKYDPMRGFGSPEHRKAVENAAVKATMQDLEKRGYKCVSREKENVGYDLDAKHDTEETLHVEVKGTSLQQPRFFMTKNENCFMKEPSWRLSMVTNALDSPAVRIMTLAEVDKMFDLQPIVWKGVQKST